MGKSRAMEQVELLVGNMMSSQQYSGKLLESQGLDPKRMQEVAPMDDGVPPNIPSGIEVVPFMKALEVRWTVPPKSEAVKRADVEVTPLNDPPYIVKAELTGILISNLAYKEHSIRVRFVDMWERVSSWSAPYTGTPAETADYKINMLKAQQAGNLQGLIPAANLQGDGSPENMFKHGTLAQPDGSNILPLSEVDFDQWPDGQVWSPPDTNKDNVKYIIHSAPSGISGVITDRAGLKWLAITRNTTTDSWYIPHAYIKQRGIQPETEYIASVFARGNSGVRVRLEIRLFKDTAGTDPFILQGDVVTLDGSSGGSRLYRKFMVPGGYNTMQFVLHTVDNNTESQWTKFQLEYAGGKIEPSTWTPGMITTGVLAARMIMAMDVNATNAVFKNAAIESAAIGTLTADKIVGGTINTNVINIASQLNIATGGKVKAGVGTTVDANGIELVTHSTYDARAINRTYKITDSNDRSALAFYDVGSWTGAILRGDGTGTAKKGRLGMHATVSGTLLDSNGNYHITAGVVEVVSDGSRGWVYLNKDAYITGNQRVYGNAVIDGTLDTTGAVHINGIYVGFNTSHGTYALRTMAHGGRGLVSTGSNAASPAWHWHKYTASDGYEYDTSYS